MGIKKKFFFEYIYYRLTKAYLRWDGKDGSTAIVGITMIQLLLLTDFLSVTLRLFFSRNDLSKYPNTGKLIILAVFILLALYNLKRYNNKYEELESCWKSENRKKRIYKGILVILSLTIPWVPFLLVIIFWK